MKEFERTYLCQQLPSDLFEAPYREIIDNHVVKTARHPVLRLRKDGEKMYLTKKTPLKADNSIFEEQTIVLSQEEYDVFNTLEGKRLRKLRYLYPYKDHKTCEIDIFLDDLRGLCLIDFEFKNEEEKDKFIPPPFCFVEVTDREFVAGGYLCGKRYEDIKNELAILGYKRLQD